MQKVSYYLWKDGLCVLSADSMKPIIHKLEAEATPQRFSFVEITEADGKRTPTYACDGAWLLAMQTANNNRKENRSAANYLDE